jgi:hypothetical protein
VKYGLVARGGNAEETNTEEGTSTKERADVEGRGGRERGGGSIVL